MLSLLCSCWPSLLEHPGAPLAHMLPFVPPDEPGTVGEVPGLPEVRLYDVLGFGGLPVVPPDSATTPLTEDSV
jgi:hypothetical protein